MKKYVMGIDVGGTSVKIGQFDHNGKLLSKWEIPTNTSDSGKYILTDIYDSIKKKIALDDIEGFGFGVPGPVVNGVVNRCVNLGWGVTDLVREFTELVPNHKVFCDNDANVATYGESFMGAAKGERNVVMITLGTGVGGGIIANGEILQGATGAGGEIGHMIVKENGFLCNCGNKGCLETYVSATGIINQYKIKCEEHNKEITDTINAKYVIDLAKNDDKLALEVIDEVTLVLGKALGVLSTILNPNVFVIGGGVSKAGDFLLDKVRNNFMRNSYFASRDVRIVPAELGNDAGMYGAAMLVLQHD